MSTEAVQQAIEWFVKLRSADASSAERHAHAEWLQESPENRGAYDQVCREWADLDELENWARNDLAQLNLANGARTRRSSRMAMMSLAAAAMLILGLFVWPIYEDKSEHFQTAKAEQRQITLDDGSRLHLNSETDIEVRYRDELREIRLKQGEGIFDVESDTHRPFLVRAAGNSIIALGTRFSVEYLNDREVEVTVLEGRVAVVPEEQSIESMFNLVSDAKVENLVEESKSVILKQDQQVVASLGEHQPVVEVNADAETSWREGKLIFNGTPLREVVLEMSRYVPGHIRVADNVPDYPVTGIVLIRSSENMLEFRSQVVPITPIRQSASITVVHAAPAQPPNG